ncbi:MAG: hypothetical protein Q8P45_02800 [Candidatus Harrisonbacteria bacterium]|nr:hypothetical protein [Candidatus Harrisonbacteria bacterium]
MTKKFFVLAFSAAIIAFLLTPVIWPYAIDAAHMPPSSVLPFFMVVVALSELAFGIGIAFLIFGYKAMRKAERGYGLSFWAFLSTVWLLISWWPHENLHRVSEGNYYALVWIEYIFHVSLYAAGVILALYLLKHFKALRPENQNS